MTFEQAMVSLVVTFYGAFTVVFVVGAILGAAGFALVRGPRERVRPQPPSGSDGLMDVAYSVGVAKASHPFGDRCPHGVQFLNECLDCPDGCPQVVA